MVPDFISVIFSFYFSVFFPPYLPVLSASVGSVGIIKKENSTDITKESVIDNIIKESLIDNITERLLGEEHHFSNERGKMLVKKTKSRNKSKNLNNEHQENVDKLFHRNALHPKTASNNEEPSGKDKIIINDQQKKGEISENVDISKEDSNNKNVDTSKEVESPIAQVLKPAMRAQTRIRKNILNTYNHIFTLPEESKKPEVKLITERKIAEVKQQNVPIPETLKPKHNLSTESKIQKPYLPTESQNPKMNLSEESQKPEVNETESRTPPEMSTSSKGQQESPHPKADVPAAEALPSIVNRGKKYLHKIDPTTFIRWHSGNKSAIFERGLLVTTRKDCSFGYIRHDDRCYSVFDVLTHYDDCIVICHLFGGYIAVPTTTTTKDFIQRQMTNSVETMNLTQDNPYWLGVTYIQNVWRIYHTPSIVLNYLRWAPGEPKSLAPNQCAAVRLTDGLWMTYDCRLWAYCICDSDLMDIQNVSPYG